MRLMRTRLLWPLPTRNRAFPATRIGWLLGGRDHSIVMHGVAVITADDEGAEVPWRHAA